MLKQTTESVSAGEPDPIVLKCLPLSKIGIIGYRNSASVKSKAKCDLNVDRIRGVLGHIYAFLRCMRRYELHHSLHNFYEVAGVRGLTPLLSLSVISEKKQCGVASTYRSKLCSNLH